MAKAKDTLSIKLNPQNEEWIGLIPNQTKNLDNFFNKLIEESVRSGDFIRIITETLSITDLQKFKVSYTRLNSKIEKCLEELEVEKTTPQQPQSPEEIEEREEEATGGIIQQDEDYEDTLIGNSGGFSEGVF